MTQEQIEAERKQIRDALERARNQGDAEFADLATQALAGDLDAWIDCVDLIEAEVA